MEPLTTLAEVDRIAGMTDPVLRNQQITQSYYQISTAFSTRTGPCANWCTFATWASKQAGQTIRREDLLKALENHLEALPELGQAIYDIAGAALEKGAGMDKKGIAQLVWDIADPKAAMLRASAAVARGNQKVYVEIAREFARFLNTIGKDEQYNAGHIDHFCNTLKPGDPPDGQRYLKQAFECYYRAFFESNPKQKAEYILLANIEVGFHEQTRLQPEIAEAMEASVVDPKIFRAKLLKTLFPNQIGWLATLVSMFRGLFNMPSPLDTAIEKFTKEARRRLRLFLSAHMMELGLPKGARLQLGKDLKAGFPPHLRQLSNADLIALLNKIDPTADSVKETAAIDWANFDDRVHFIADLFRCYQESEDLLVAPFEDSED